MNSTTISTKSTTRPLATLNMPFMGLNINITALIAVPLTSSPYPFPPLPAELVRLIVELAASHDTRAARSFLLVSTAVRRWVHPIAYETVEIFGLRRMIDFATLFAGQSLLATSVRNLTLYDDTTGDFVHPSLAVDIPFMHTILSLCRGVRRLAVNYIRGMPAIEGRHWQLHELTIRRGLRGITLQTPPFDCVTHLHCRYEQLTQSFIKRLATARLTHVCFTHHLDFPDDSCRSAVTHFLDAPRIQVLIVEVAYQKWHQFEDPSVRRTLAENTDERLFMRLSKYDTVRPYDHQPVFSNAGTQNNVWNIAGDRDWRSRAWDTETISRVYGLVKDRTLTD